MWVWHTFDSLVYSLLSQVPNKSAAIQVAHDVEKKAVEEGDTKRDNKGVLLIRVYLEDYCESLPSSRVRKRRRVTRSETTGELLQSHVTE